jgi:hypothetical protein
MFSSLQNVSLSGGSPQAPPSSAYEEPAFLEPVRTIQPAGSAPADEARAHSPVARVSIEVSEPEDKEAEAEQAREAEAEQAGDSPPAIPISFSVDLDGATTGDRTQASADAHAHVAHDSDGPENFGDSDDEEFVDAATGEAEGNSASDSDGDINLNDLPPAPTSFPPEAAGAVAPATVPTTTAEGGAASAVSPGASGPGPKSEKKYCVGLLTGLRSRMAAQSTSNNAGFKQEWQKIEVVNAGASTAVGSDPRNEGKNKYSNYRLFDDTRVKLVPIDHDESSEYINASFVRDCTGSRA